MSRHRPFFLLPALVLTILVAGLGGSAFQRKLESFQPLGVELVESGGVYAVASTDRPDTGLLPGDLLLLVRQETPKSSHQLRQSFLSAEESPVLVQRGDELQSVVYRRPPVEIDFVYLALAAIGVFYLLIGLYTSLNDRRPSARLFFFWCLTSAALFLLSPRQVPVDPTDRWIFLVDQLSRTLMPALTLHLMLVFPGRWTERPVLRRILACLYLPSLLSIAFYTDQTLLDGRFTGSVTAASLAALDRLEMIYWVAAFLAGAWILGTRLMRRPDWEHRRQLQWIAVGLVAGHVPFLVAYVLPWSLSLPTPAWSTLLAVLPMGLVPLTFAYAIFKYRLMDMGLVLRSSVSYSVAGIVAIFGFQGAQLAIEQGLGPDLSTTRNMLTFAAGLVIAGALVPTRNAVAQSLERLQYRGLWGRRRLLQALGGSLLHERDLPRLCETLTRELTDGLATRVELYLLQKDGRLLPMRPRPEIPQTLELSSLGDDLWQRDVESLTAVQLPEETPSPEQHLFAAGYRYAFPLRVQTHPVGMVVMSYKYDQDPLDGEDLELVQGLLSQAALAIENAGLLKELSSRLDEVRALQAQNRGILESSPAGIAMLDGDGHVLSANNSLAEICDLPPNRLLGRRLEELLPVTPLPATGAPPIQVGYCTAEGLERYLQLQVAAYRPSEAPSPAVSSGNDEDLGIQGESSAGSQRVAVVQDVTAQVALEMELREKEHLASLGMLAAGVAHEVNTPLTGISSYAQFLMAGTDEDDPRFELMQKLERQTFRASQIVNNLLEFSRNRRGEMSRVELQAIVGESLGLLEVRAAKADVELVWSASSEPCFVLGNEGELHQVISNLVANAIDALSNRPSPRRVVVSLAWDPQRVTLRVSDTGPGIPPERLETIFKPFFSSKLGRGGSGLGLAICYNILRRHAGQIRVENNPKEKGGCVFSVELPAYQAVTH